MIWAADQASSDGGFILAGELVCSVDCPTLPLAPIPDLNQMMFVTTKNHNGTKEADLHEILEDCDAEGVSQGAGRE